MPPCLRADRSAATLRFARNKGGAWNRALCCEGRGIVLWIPHDTEPDEVVDAAGRAEVAPRRAAVAGVVVPDAAAQQTVITSRGPCRVGHAS